MLRRPVFSSFRPFFPLSPDATYHCKCKPRRLGGVTQLPCHRSAPFLRHVNLGESEVVASGGNGLQNLASQYIIALVLGEIKFCTTRSANPLLANVQGEDYHEAYD